MRGKSYRSGNILPLPYHSTGLETITHTPYNEPFLPPGRYKQNDCYTHFSDVNTSGLLFCKIEKIFSKPDQINKIIRIFTHDFMQNDLSQGIAIPYDLYHQLQPQQNR